MSVKELARQGTNTKCVDCAAAPLFGGMRCLTCFQQRSKRNAGVEHLCARHEPSASCYQLCRCRCEGCKDGKRAYARRFR